MTDNPVISVVSPVYKAAGIVDELVRQLIENLTQITDRFEIILVDDASRDGSWEKILSAAGKDPRVKGIGLTRNFGQQIAITAGLRYAQGEWVVVMDCDLQDRPDEIKNLYRKAKEGYDVVYASRKERKDGLFKRTASKMFHLLFSYSVGSKTDSSIANFGIFSRRVIQQYNRMKDTSRSFIMLIEYMGFKSVSIPVVHSPRTEGKSSYLLKKKIGLAWDIILSGGNNLLSAGIKLGVVIILLSLLAGLYNLIVEWIRLPRIPGYSLAAFSIWLIGGLIMVQIGLAGIYIGRILEQVKGRPLYLIADTINIDQQ